MSAASFGVDVSMPWEPDSQINNLVGYNLSCLYITEQLNETYRTNSILERLLSLLQINKPREERRKRRRQFRGSPTSRPKISDRIHAYIWDPRTA